MNQIEELRSNLWESLKLLDNLIATGRAEQQIKEITKPKEFKTHVNILINKMCAHWGIKPADLIKHSQTRPVVEKRQVACMILKKYGTTDNGNDVRLDEIADLLGYKSHAHATVKHHLSIMEGAVDGSYNGYDHLAKDFNNIRRKIGAL